MIVPYEPWHLPLARLKAEPLADVNAAGPQLLVDLSKNGLCETIFTDDFGKVLGIVAAIPDQFIHDTAEVMVLATEDQHRFPVVFAKCVRASLDTIRKHFANITAIGDDTPELKRWFTWLGFALVGPVNRPELVNRKMLLWNVEGRKN